MRSVNVFCVWGAGGANHLRVFLPLGPLFSAGRPVSGVQRPPTFLGRLGLRPAFGEKPLFDYSVGIGPPLADPIPPGARRHFARGPCRAASGDDYIAGSLCSSPARSARSAFAVQLRPAFAALPASGIDSHRPIQAACVSQRYARRPGGGTAVMPSVHGAFTAFDNVLLCGPAPIANLRWRSIKASKAAATLRGRRSVRRSIHSIHSIHSFPRPREKRPLSFFRALISGRNGAILLRKRYF